MNQLLNEIKTHEFIIIHGHIKPDGDCVGAQIGLKEIIKTSFPQKTVYTVGDEVEHLMFIGRMDQVETKEYENALVIVVDVANKERLSDKRFNQGKSLYIIDHHPSKEEVTQNKWIDSSYASTCEMIVDFYNHHQEELILNEKARIALYYGIITDTSRFLNPRVNSRTFKLASILLEESIDLSVLYQEIYNVPIPIARLRGYALSNFTCTDHGVGTIKLTKELTEQFHVDAGVTSFLTHVLAHITEVIIWVISIYDHSNDKIRVSLRSRNVPINEIAAKYGGGGHINASGVILDDFLKVDELVDELDQYLKQK